MPIGVSSNSMDVQVPDSPFKPNNRKWIITNGDDAPSVILLNYAKGKIIPELEARYGPRDLNFHLVKIVFGGEYPYTQYPGRGGRFQISLTTCCDRQPISYRAIFQLAHECLHALKPVEFGAATVLEEGLAAESSLMPDKTVFERWDPGCDYRRAYMAVRNLRGLIDLNGYIKKYRADNPCTGISDITCEDMCQAIKPRFLAKFDELIRGIPMFSSFERWRKSLYT